MNIYQTNSEKTKGSPESKLHKNSFFWIWRVIGKYKAYIALLLIVQVLFGLCSVTYAMLFRALIDYAAAGRSDGFFRTVFFLAGLTLGQLLLDIAGRFLSEWINATLENRLKERLFSCLLRKDYSAVTEYHTGEWVTRLTSDTAVVAGGVTGIFPGLAGMFARLAGALAALFYLTPTFFCILVPLGLFIILLSSVFRKVLKRLHKKIQETNGAVLAFFQERLENLMIIRVFSREQQTCDEAARKMDQHRAARVKRNFFSTFCNSGFEAVVNLGYLFGAFYCGYGILEGTVSYGTFTAVLQLIGQIQSRFAGISGLVPQYYAMTASAERLMEAESYADDHTEEHVPMEEIHRFYKEDFYGIGMRNASFAYPSAKKGSPDCGGLPVIFHFNLDIKKGEYIAFTGHSGCGKSTLLKLLMCLYPLDEGELYLKVRKEEEKEFEYNEEIPLTPAWRELFSYVPQGNQLMSGTIREIIAFGDTEGMKEEFRIKQALKISCSDEFISDLENGIDTRLGESGCGLSEGQMQRIAIARAVFSDRPILILDESTSSLDESTEQNLLKNLRQMTDKTVLIITHRPAALEICDREIVMTAVEFGDCSY